MALFDGALLERTINAIGEVQVGDLHLVSLITSSSNPSEPLPSWSIILLGALTKASLSSLPMVTLRIKRTKAGQAFSFLVMKTTCKFRSHFTCSVITQEAGPYWRDLTRAAIDQN